MKGGGLVATSKVRVALLVTGDAWSIAGCSASHVGPPVSHRSEMDQMQLVMEREGKLLFFLPQENLIDLWDSRPKWRKGKELSVSALHVLFLKSNLKCVYPVSG